MGMIMSYLVFGITCKKRGCRIITALGCGILGLLAALDWKMETALVMICALAVTGVSLWCLYWDRREADGDYAAFLEDDLDQAWLDFVIKGISEYLVLFSPGYREPQAGHPDGENSRSGDGPALQVTGSGGSKDKDIFGFLSLPAFQQGPQSIHEVPGSVEIAPGRGRIPVLLPFTGMNTAVTR
jgi:hypothetical protein